MTPARRLMSIRSTPVRLTVTLVLVFSISSLVTFAVAYGVMRSNFDANLSTQVRQAMDSYRVARTPKALVDHLTADAITASPEAVILQYSPDFGPRLSNVGFFPPVSGFEVIGEDQIEGKELADSYLALSARVAGGQLIVAHTREQIDEMGEVFLAVFLISLLPTIIAAAVIGMVAARRAQSGIDVIGATLRQLTNGHLEARVALTNQDVDDLAVIGRAVNQMANAQEASVASLRQVSADIAHDLKTPIQRVAVMLDRLSGGKDLTAEQANIVDDALDEIDRIVKTFQSLLQISQIEGGQMREQFKPVDLREVTETIVDVFDAAASDAGHKLSLHIAGEGPFVVAGDKPLLGQVLANLVENGLRHVPEGGRIDVTLSRQGSTVLLRVADDGPGIPEGERGKVLQRLYRLERSRTSEGNGLGLSMVAAVADLHSARLSLKDSTPGLIVQVAFPAVAG